MEKRVIPPSELIINEDGSIFHLHLKPEQLADKVILCGDPARVDVIANRLSTIECSVSNREFHTVTGWYKDKRVTIQSHGIGGDNIEIVVNELDALANINLQNRQTKDTLRSLSIVRIGTSGGLQPETPIGTFVAARKCIGFDGVINFYANTEQIRDLRFEQELISQLDWSIKGLAPYVVPADEELFERIVGDGREILSGCTIAANGFYGPQGRSLRIPLKDACLNRKITDFCFNGEKISNFEMESASLAGVTALLGHKALTVCCIIAGRQNLNVNTNYQDSLERLIDLVLQRI
ncbi:MAG: nucleoside phosphorylase [Porphyromonas sp.]|nr:nucleoside phosphorylase [Porphyromonas sp.]